MSYDLHYLLHAFVHMVYTELISSWWEATVTKALLIRARDDDGCLWIEWKAKLGSSLPVTVSSCPLFRGCHRPIVSQLPINSLFKSTLWGRNGNLFLEREDWSNWRLIENWRNLSKPDEAALPLVIEEFSLNALIRVLVTSTNYP